MQFINDDMERMLREAAEAMPVKPAGSDWEAVQQRLRDHAVDGKQKKRGDKNFMLLGVFLLFSLVLNKYNKLLFLQKQAEVHAQPAGSAINGAKKENGEPLALLPTGHLPRGIGNDAPGRSLLSFKKNTTPADPITQPPVVQQDQVKTEAEKITEPGTVTESKERTAEKILPAFPDVADSSENRKPATGPEDQTAAQQAVTKNSKREENVKRSKWYITALAGPDISTVKWQKIHATGYSAGVLLGFKGGKRWAVEAGALWEKKSYYTSGEYFDAEYAYLPSHAYLLNADGACFMIDIPVNLRYDIVQKDKSRWYGVAGVSSYLMKKEAYDYSYKRYNNYYKSSQDYRNKSQNWMSVLNLSAGYERLIGKSVSLRVEPYMKLPVQGVGVGKLSLTSTGLYIGISYPFR